MQTIMKEEPRKRILILGGLCLAMAVASLAGCASGGASDTAGTTTPSASDDAATKNNFTRPATDAEKAKANNAPPKVP